MFEAFLLASDADEMKKEKEKPSVKSVEMRKSTVAIWGKDKATGQFSQWWKKVLRPLSTVTWKGNSVTELSGYGITEKKKKKKRQERMRTDGSLSFRNVCASAQKCPWRMASDQMIQSSKASQ